jgi:hypothetical protein
MVGGETRFASILFDVDLFGVIEYALDRFEKVPEIGIDGELL